MADLEPVIIRVLDFVEDPRDDAAFAITFEVVGPGKLQETLRVSFTDEFIKTYFNIPWFKDLPQEEKKLIHERQSLFVQWALVRIEAWLDSGAKEENKLMVLTPDKDITWTKKIGAGTHRPASEPRGEREFVYFMEAK